MSKPPKLRDLKDFTFDELVDDATHRAHSELLKEGGNGLRSAIFMTLERAIRWSREQKDWKD